MKHLRPKEPEDATETSTRRKSWSHRPSSRENRGSGEGRHPWPLARGENRCGGRSRHDRAPSPANLRSWFLSTHGQTDQHSRRFGRGGRGHLVCPEPKLRAGVDGGRFVTEATKAGRLLPAKRIRIRLRVDRVPLPRTAKGLCRSPVCEQLVHIGISCHAAVHGYEPRPSSSTVGHARRAGWNGAKETEDCRSSRGQSGRALPRSPTARPRCRCGTRRCPPGNRCHPDAVRSGPDRFP